MSYSFSVRAPTKEAVIEKIGAELDKVVEAQPMHKHDRNQAIAAAKAFVDILPDSAEGCEFSVSVHGSLGWNQGPDAEDADAAKSRITGTSVGVSAGLVPPLA
jgi:hypothetical protein